MSSAEREWDSRAASGLARAAGEPQSPGGLGGLQILLFAAGRPPLVAGIPGVVRTAHDLAVADPTRRVVLCARSAAFVEAWRDRLARLPGGNVAWCEGARPAPETLVAGAPALILGPRGAPDAAALEAFIRDARLGPAPAAWVWNGRVVAAYYQDASQVAPLGPGVDGFARRLPAPPHAWEPLTDAGSIRRAEGRLFRSLRKDSDGYLARLDRTLSIALSRVLVRAPAVTPNRITLASLVVGLTGAALLASGGYWLALVGAALLWSCCVLDGCDGEVARLTLRASRAGARLDVVADNIVHLAVFVAIPIHLRRAHPEFTVWPAAAALLTGVLLSMFSVWWLILRQPEEGRARLARVYERIASRDFVYVVLLLAVVDRLQWFLWSTAIGANLFVASLWWFGRSRRSG